MDGRNTFDSGNPLEDSRLSLGQLAHELNSRLDGSLRSLRLAETALTGDRPLGVDPERALQRLRAARQAMDEIAGVLARAMSGHQAGVELLRTDGTLGQEIDRVLVAVEDRAREAGVALTVELDAAAASLPAGPLGAVILNGLRNGIDACCAGGASLRRVELAVGYDATHGRLRVLVTDTGPGAPAELAPGTTTKPGGHGLGLAVCRDVVAALGGELDLQNVPFGRGAVLRVEVPMRGLAAA